MSNLARRAKSRIFVGGCALFVLLALGRPANAQFLFPGCIAEGAVSLQGPGGGDFPGVSSFRIVRPPDQEHNEASGHIVFVSPAEGIFVGRAETLNCSINGVAVGDVTGTGQWNGEPVTFTLVLADWDTGSTDFGILDNYILRLSSEEVEFFELIGEVMRGDITVMEF